MRRLRTQEVLDLEDYKREKRGKNDCKRKEPLDLSLKWTLRMDEESVVTVYEPITTTLIGTTAPINSGNKNGTEEGNIRTCSKPIGTTANNVMNTWSKYGLVKSMLNSSNGLFFFQFSFKDGLDAMLENGHWFSVVKIGLGGQYIGDISVINSQPIPSVPSVQSTFANAKRKSKDVGWEYDVIPDPSKPDRIKCTLCHKLSLKKGKDKNVKLSTFIQKERIWMAKKYISRWAYESAIPFHAFEMDSFKMFLEVVGQFGTKLPQPTRYEMSITLLKEEGELIKAKEEIKKDMEIQHDHNVSDAVLEFFNTILAGDLEMQKQVTNVEMPKYKKKWIDLGTFSGATPNLKKIAMRILSLTSSSSECERNWSTKFKRRKERNVEVLLSNDSHMAQQCIVECDGDGKRDGDEEVKIQPDPKVHWEAIGEAMEADKYLQPRKSSRTTTKTTPREIFNEGFESGSEEVVYEEVWVKLHGVPMTVFTEDGLSAIATKLADVELKDIIMVAMPKLVGEGFHMCTIHVEYEWKPPRCLSCKVGPKVDFKHIKQVYRLVSNRNNAGSSGKKKQVAVASKKVSNSNPFDVLNSVKKDDNLGTNRGHSKLTGKGPSHNMYPSDKGFLNVASSSTTPIVERVDEIERRIINGKITLVDDDGKPLHKVVSTKIMDSDSEVENAVDHHAVFMASTSLKRGVDSGYGTNSLLEQWRKIKRDDAFDPYDDDLYESHDISKNL
nr:hypothetical protein [Tanacetum cinerariifolium]